MLLDEYGGEFSAICSTLSHLQADVVGFCKTKLDTTKYAVRHILASHLKRSFRNHHLAMSTCTVPFKGYNKPGGTMSFCVDHNTSRFSARFQDPMGRWSTLLLIGCNKRIVHFITVYQVVAKDLSCPYTAFQQQLQCFRLADRDLPPRQAFLINVEKYIKSVQTPSSQFVVKGDFNEVVGTSMSEFAKITSEFWLVNVIGHFHSVRNEVLTYARGPNCLDYVFCSNTLLLAVVACGAKPFNQHIFSDHRALFVDWDEVLLFSAQTPLIQ
jgi:hypothetical protein